MDNLATVTVTLTSNSWKSNP